MSEEVKDGEMSLVKKVFIFSLFCAFLVMGAVSMKRALPEDKEERIYKAIKAYSPYVYEKRLGGLTIVDTRTKTKEKPSAAEVLYRMDELDKLWAKEHITVDGNEILISTEHNGTISIIIQTPKERAFLKSFFNL